MRSRRLGGPRPIGIVTAWLVAIIWCFPILYMLITSFKLEADVIPPSLWVSHPTLENYRVVLQQEIVRYSWIPPSSASPRWPAACFSESRRRT